MIRARSFVSLDAKTESLTEAVSAFGADAKARLSNPAIVGEAEDQLRAIMVNLGAPQGLLHGRRLAGQTMNRPNVGFPAACPRRESTLSRRLARPVMASLAACASLRK
jgi:hypothetical protein